MKRWTLASNVYSKAQKATYLVAPGTPISLPPCKQALLLPSTIYPHPSLNSYTHTPAQAVSTGTRLITTGAGCTHHSPSSSRVPCRHLQPPRAKATPVPRAGGRPNSSRATLPPQLTHKEAAILFLLASLPSPVPGLSLSLPEQKKDGPPLTRYCPFPAHQTRGGTGLHIPSRLAH